MLPFSADAMDVLDLARSLRQSWSKQRVVDNLMLDLYRQRHIVNVSDPSGGSRDSRMGDTNRDIEAIGMGKGPQIVDQWAALMGGRLRPHVAPLGNSPASLEHATTLEEFSEGAFLRMEQRMGPQWPGIRKDIALYGRGAGVVLPQPQFWSPKANPEFRKKRGETKEEWLERTNNLKRQNFPISFTKLDARSTYFRFGEFSYDCVRIRNLLAGEIINKFEAPELRKRIDSKELKLDSSIEVVDYFNDVWFGMFTKTDELKRREHFMGVNPVVLFGGNPMPDNDEMKWYGILYHARHLIPAYDELISNILTNVRRDTRALTIVPHDHELEGTDAAIAGRPKATEITPGGQLDVWKGEEPSRLGSASSNTDYSSLLPEIGGGLGAFLRKIFMGQARSDTTGTAVRLVAELANILQNDTVEGIRTGGKGLYVRIFHAVTALEEEVKGLKAKPDKVYVRAENKKQESREIAITANDVRGYDDLIQVRYGLQTPTDQRSIGEFVRLMTEDRPGTGPVIDMTTGREQAGFENPQDIEDRVWRQRVTNSPEFISKIVGLAGEAFEGARQTEKDLVSPEQMQLLQQILSPEQMEILLGGSNGAAPTPQGSTSNVPLVDGQRAGEQESVQAPR